MSKKKSDIQIVVNDVNNSNFGKSLSILRDSNFDKYTQVIRQEDVLKSIFSKSKIKISQKESFLKNLANLLQSLTVRGFYTYEIVHYIAAMIDELKDDKETKEILRSSIQIFHSNYEKTLNSKQYRNVKQILFNHTSEKEDGDPGRGVYIEYSDVGNNFFDELSYLKDHKRDIKILGLFGNSINESQSIEENKKAFIQEFNSNTINKDILNPSKTNPSFSSILVTNPDFRIGTRNSLELSTFFNTISNIELSRSYPYFNATFVLPTVSRRDKKLAFKSSTINQFLFGSLNKKTTKNYDNLSGDPVINPNTGKPREDVIQTNLALFTTPQSLVNLNENIGHSINNPSTLRLTSVHDSTKPFMTIKSFTTNTAPTKGLMSYKTGKLSITIHDRTRIADIAPFVKPDLYGSFGSEIVLEYGWSNPDENNPKENPVGAFIGNSKVIEKYSIVNSSMNIEANGIVNIELSLATKGAHEFKNAQMSSYPKDRLEKGEIGGAIQIINESRKNLGLTHSMSFLSRLSSNEDAIISDKNRIDSDSRFAIQNLFEKYQFLFKISDIDTTYDIIEFDPVEGEFSLEAADPPIITQDNLNSLREMVSKKDTDDLFFIKKAGLNVSLIRDEIRSVMDALKSLLSILQKIIEEDNAESDLEKQFLSIIIGGTKYIDPFFPHDVLEKINNIGDYISLGTVINSLVCTHIVSTKQYDEVQTIFYNANEEAGGMAAKNLAGFLIRKTLLTELFEDLLVGRKIITLESMISQILLKLVQTSDNISLGISDLYEERKKFSDSIKLKNPDPKKFSKLKNTKLFEIYYPGKTPTAEDLNDVNFKVPIINMSFDCITSEKDKNKTILRISIFDRNDSPFNQASQIMDEIYATDFLKSTKKLNKARLDFETGEISRKKYKEKIQEQIKLLLDKNVLIKDKKTENYIIDPKLGTGIAAKSKIKEIYKEIFPSLTFGSQNSAIISANVSSINDNKLDTLFIARPDRNNINELNSRVQTDLPLNIRPSQASIELIGCPWINFSQFIYLDFGTGTTIDNKYAVTGITHNFSPGKFTTNLVLSYSDNFGQFDAGTDIVSQALKEISTIPSKKSQTKKISSGGLTNRFIIPVDYEFSKKFKAYKNDDIIYEGINTKIIKLDMQTPFLSGVQILDSTTHFINAEEKPTSAFDESVKPSAENLDVRSIISSSPKTNICLTYENNYLHKILDKYFEIPEDSRPKSLYNFITNSFVQMQYVNCTFNSTDSLDFSIGGLYRFSDNINKPIPQSRIYKKYKHYKFLVKDNSEIKFTISDIEQNIFGTRSTIDYSKNINILDKVKKENIQAIKDSDIAQFALQTPEEKFYKEFEKIGLDSTIFLKISLEKNFQQRPKSRIVYLIDFLGSARLNRINFASETEREVRDNDDSGFFRIEYISNLERNLKSENNSIVELTNNNFTNERKIYAKIAPDLKGYKNEITYNDALNHDDIKSYITSESIATLNEISFVKLTIEDNKLKINFNNLPKNYFPVENEIKIYNHFESFINCKKESSLTYSIFLDDIANLYEISIPSYSAYKNEKSLASDQWVNLSIGQFGPSSLGSSTLTQEKSKKSNVKKVSTKKNYNLPILKYSAIQKTPVILSIPNIVIGDLKTTKAAIDEIELLYTVEDLVRNVNTESKLLEYTTSHKNNFKKSNGLSLDQTRKIPSISFTRNYPIQPRLFTIIEKAIEFTNKDLNQYLGQFALKSGIKATITSAGSEPYYSYYNARKSDPSLPVRDKSTIRHDLGFALDVELKATNAQNQEEKFQLLDEGTPKLLSNLNLSADTVLSSIKNNSIIFTFLYYAKQLGITAIGADYDYSEGKAFHLDIARYNQEISQGKYNELQTAKIVSSSPISGEYWGSSGGGKNAAYGARYTPDWLKNIFEGHAADEKP